MAGPLRCSVSTTSVARELANPKVIDGRKITVRLDFSGRNRERSDLLEYLKENVYGNQELAIRPIGMDVPESLQRFPIHDSLEIVATQPTQIPRANDPHEHVGFLGANILPDPRHHTPGISPHFSRRQLATQLVCQRLQFLGQLF